MLNKKSLDGHVDALILGILVKQPSYGYRIVQQLNELAPDVLRMGEGTVYPVLHRMEERGLLTAKWEKGKSGRPRKYYYVSRHGKQQLATAEKQWIALRRLMDVVFPKELPSRQPHENGALL